MPRGRHRHSPPLHRLLPPSAIAGVSVVCAFGPWVFSEAVILRALAGAAAVTAVVGAVVMRHWDAQAGKRVADLTRARASDEWRFEERVAELESDLDESRELRVKLEQRLRAKRAELAGLRNEHAALLRRYATAETERASALEGRRLLEIEATPSAPALPAARPAPEQETRVPGAGEETAGFPAVFSPAGAELYLRANSALARLAGDASTAADNEAGDGDDGGDDGDGGGKGGGESAAAAEAAREETAPARPEAADGHETAPGTTQPGRPGERSARTGEQPAAHHPVPAAVAVVPAAPARRPVAEGGFDFFGTKNAKDTTASPAALEAVQNEDLADVVGQEALALHKAETEAAFKPAGEESRAVGQVIDLTAHDETEQIDVQGLRSAAS
ncbi:hypothetical protein AB0O68_31485 [Streptomyces sp. NPDC087512]|uniref:hypothetical protein n=1 Tax=Streptomyces sp. NPDC087512 TaxID=3155059 RepID=UPI0034433984